MNFINSTQGTYLSVVSQADYRDSKDIVQTDNCFARITNIRKSNTNIVKSMLNHMCLLYEMSVVMEDTYNEIAKKKKYTFNKVASKNSEARMLKNCLELAKFARKMVESTKSSLQRCHDENIYQNIYKLSSIRYALSLISVIAAEHYKFTYKFFVEDAKSISSLFVDSQVTLDTLNSLILLQHALLKKLFADENELIRATI